MSYGSFGKLHNLSKAMDKKTRLLIVGNLVLYVVRLDFLELFDGSFARETGCAVQFFFNTQQLVIFGDAFTA
jgi:hypothetical protein